MWPFNKSLSATVSSDDEISEAQIAKFFSDASPKVQYRDVEVTSMDATGAKVTKIERRQEEVEVSLKEEPCNLQYYFDEFFMCYTPKSQLRNWYRYGEKKDCAERWRDFKWCMTTLMVDEEASQSMLAHRKVELNERVLSGPNSEEIWQIRKSPLHEPWQGYQGDTKMSIS